MNKQEYQKLLVFYKKEAKRGKNFPEVLDRIQEYVMSVEELELELGDAVSYRLAIEICKKNNIDKLNVVCMENIFEELKNQIENKAISTRGNLVIESDLYDLSYRLVTSGCLEDANYGHDEDDYNEFITTSDSKLEKSVKTMVKLFHKFSLKPRNHAYNIYGALEDVYALTMDMGI